MIGVVIGGIAVLVLLILVVFIVVLVVLLTKKVTTDRYLHAIQLLSKVCFLPIIIVI